MVVDGDMDPGGLEETREERQPVLNVFGTQPRGRVGQGHGNNLDANTHDDRQSRGAGKGEGGGGGRRRLHEY